MANKFDLCNSALDKIGVENILDFSDGTKAANLCSRNYDRLRKKLLRSHWWNFAIARATLTVDSTAPLFDFDSQYDLPDDCIRFLELENNQVRYRVEGDKKLLIDSGGDDVNLVYVYDMDDVDSMTDDFYEGLAYLIASELAYPMLQSKTLAESMYAKYKEEIQLVRTVDSQISSNDGMQANQWLNSRRVDYPTNGKRAFYWN